jgi:hypothetical protein
MVMVASSLLMGDKAFFLLGDDCFLGNLVALVGCHVCNANNDGEKGRSGEDGHDDDEQ